MTTQRMSSEHAIAALARMVPRWWCTACGADNPSFKTSDGRCYHLDCPAPGHSGQFDPLPPLAASSPTLPSEAEIRLALETVVRQASEAADPAVFAELSTREANVTLRADLADIDEALRQIDEALHLSDPNVHALSSVSGDVLRHARDVAREVKARVQGNRLLTSGEVVSVMRGNVGNAILGVSAVLYAVASELGMTHQLTEEECEHAMLRASSADDHG